jgi:hypothetical protein
MVRTAVNHTANSARQIMYEQNQDVLDGWQFVAVLSSSPLTHSFSALRKPEQYDYRQCAASR